jgi:hypothetical protein
MTPEPFVDATAVAGFLAITRRQALELARAGKIPAHPLGGGRRRTWRFRLGEVDQAVSTLGAKKSVSVDPKGHSNPKSPSRSITIAEAVPEIAGGENSDG